MLVKRASISTKGPELSEIALGTWRILDAPKLPTAKVLAERIEAAIELGITTLDTAEIYGEYKVEQAVGRALAEAKELKDQVEIVTKAGIDIPAKAKSNAVLPHYNATAVNIIASAENSLKYLGIDQIDVFLIHRPDWLTPAEETAKGLGALFESGKIKSAGVSNYTTHQFDLLNHYLDGDLVTNQIEVSLLAMDALYDGVLAQCEQNRVRPMAWSVQGGGEIFGDSAAAIRIRKVCDQIRHQYQDATNDALVTAWVMNHPSRPIPITGSNQLSRIKSQAAAAGIKLARQDWYALWSAATGTSVP